MHSSDVGALRQCSARPDSPATARAAAAAAAAQQRFNRSSILQAPLFVRGSSHGTVCSETGGHRKGQITEKEESERGHGMEDIPSGSSRPHAFQPPQQQQQPSCSVKR
ncbi:unnamed protein product [Gadus morhua 'NCC']